MTELNQPASAGFSYAHLQTEEERTCTTSTGGLMTNPETKAAPALTNENQGHQVDTPILPLTPNLAKARQFAQDERRRASRALDRMAEASQVTGHRMSERWEREFCNQLAADGWDPEYLARRYGLTMRGAA